MWKFLSTLFGYDSTLHSTITAAHEAVQRAEREIASTVGLEVCPLRPKQQKHNQEVKKHTNGLDHHN